MFYHVFFKFLKYFGKGHGKQIRLMAVYTFLTSLFEFASVAIILPFLIMLIDPQAFMSNFFLRAAKQVFHLPDEVAVFKFAAIALIVTIISKNIYGIFITYWQNKLLKEWALDIKQMFMRMYLFAPFEMNVKKADSERFFEIEQTINVVFDNYIFRVIVYTTNTLVVALIFLWMISLLPKYSIIAAIFFIASASIQNKYIFKYAKLYADEKYKIMEGPYKIMQASLRCLKAIKINSAEKFFHGIYKDLSAKIMPLEEKINLLPVIPQFIIEIIFVLTVIILFVGIFNEYGLDQDKILLALGIVAISLFRILPLMYKSQVCINYMDMYREYPDKLFTLYDEFKEYENYYEDSTKERIPFENEIKVEDLTYSYDKETPVLSDINFSIKKGEYIGIIGLSGAGKTTLMDCLSGLLIGTGSILIDETALEASNIKNYQNIIGYVTQNTNTVEGSVVDNVAWGIPKEEVDFDRVVEVLKAAKLLEQLEETASGTDTFINPDGTGLSQGQLQRLGIARAFYRQPDLLIFDEATSSLDVKTENEIMDILAEKKGQMTMVAVSHRLSALKYCDRIIYMADGRIVDIGTIEELKNKHEQFLKLVQLSNIENQNEE